MSTTSCSRHLFLRFNSHHQLSISFSLCLVNLSVLKKHRSILSYSHQEFLSHLCFDLRCTKCVLVLLCFAIASPPRLAHLRVGMADLPSSLPQAPGTCLFLHQFLVYENYDTICTFFVATKSLNINFQFLPCA